MEVLTMESTIKGQVCRHGVPLAQGKVVCGYCLNPPKRLHGAAWDGASLFFPEDRKPVRNIDSHVFDHWEVGEAQIGMMDHVSSLNQLDRITFEDCEKGSERINRTQLLFRDRSTYFDRIESVSRYAKVDMKLADVMVRSFRALDLTEDARKELCKLAQWSRASLLPFTKAAHELSKEIIPPIPTLDPEVILNRQCWQLFGAPVKAPNEEIESSQPDYEAIPIGESYHAVDYYSRFKGLKRRLMVAVERTRPARILPHWEYVQGPSGAQVYHGETQFIPGKASKLYTFTQYFKKVYAGREVGAMYCLAHSIYSVIEHDLRHREAALRRWIATGSIKGMGKKLYALSSEKRIDFTPNQWKSIWELYRKRVPKRAEAPVF